MKRFMIYILIYLVIFCLTNSLQNKDRDQSFVVTKIHINISHAFKDTILSYDNLFYSIKNQYKANDSWTYSTINGIQEINIHNKNVSEISNNIFQRIKYLKVVSLKNNFLDDINGIINQKINACHYNKPALENLQIQYNNFNSINLNALMLFYPYLNNIDVSHNQISIIMQTSDGLQLGNINKCRGANVASSDRAISINLSFNKIKYLPLILYNLSITQHVTSLDLSHNQIHYLPTNFLKHHPNLKYLNVQNNNVKVISLPKILNYLSNLKILLLAHNPSTLRWLDNYTLYHKMLQTLDISNISTSQIGTGMDREELVLPHLPSLKHLNISHNVIPLGMHLTSFSFAQLTNLTHLDMSHVKNLYELPHHTFKHNARLMNVNLEGIRGIRCNCRYLVWFGNWLRQKLHNGSRVILPLNLLNHEYPNDILDMNHEGGLNASISRNYPGRTNLYEQIGRCKAELLPINDCFDREPGNTVAGQKLFTCRQVDDIPPPPLEKSLGDYKISRVKRHPRVLIKINIGQDIILSGREHLNHYNNTEDLISFSWYYKYKNKWLGLFQKVFTAKSANATLNGTGGGEPGLKLIRGSKSFLPDGTLLIKSAQRIDAGLYSLLMIKHHKVTSSTRSPSNNGMIILEDLPMVLYFGTDYFIEIWKSTILFGVGGAFTFLFFAIVVVYLIKCFKMCQCIHRRAKTQKFSRLIELLQQQTYDEVENLRNHYISQLNKLKEVCCVNMEAITGTGCQHQSTTTPKSSHQGAPHYVSHMKDCCGTYIRDYGSQVGGSVREAYASQISRMREYAALQVERMTESYAAQVDRLNAFTYGQMDRVRERYKIEAKHIGDVIEMMNINNCRTSAAVDPCDCHEEAKFYVDGEGKLVADQAGCSSFYQEVIPFDRSRIKRRLDELSSSKGGDPFFSQSEAAIRAIWERSKIRAHELWEGEPMIVQPPPSPLHNPTYSSQSQPLLTPSSPLCDVQSSEPFAFSCPPHSKKGDTKRVGAIPNGHIAAGTGEGERPQHRLLMTKSKYASLKLRRRYSGRSTAHTSPRLVKRWSGPISPVPPGAENNATANVLMNRAKKCASLSASSSSSLLSVSSSLTTCDDYVHRTTTVTAMIDNHEGDMLPSASEVTC